MEIDIKAAKLEASLRLPDARELHWYEWGTTSGYPLIFCTGAGMSGSMSFGFPHLDQLGFRLIAPDRPGSGKSSAHPSKTLQTWAEDIAILLKHLGVSRCAVLGFSQGSAFALSLAKTCPLSALAIVSGQDQLSHPTIKPLLHPDVVNMIENFERNRGEFEEWIRTNISVDWLWSFIMNSSSEHDKKIYAQQVFSYAYRQCLEEGFSQGSSGYARDLVLALDKWPVMPEEVSCPAMLWYGKLDNSTVHSPDFGQNLAKRFANARHHLCSNEGGSILWTRSEEILTELASCLGIT
jgi:pimeloyl-ACP methyl ester carboxylesterase